MRELTNREKEVAVLKWMKAHNKSYEYLGKDIQTVIEEVGEIVTEVMDKRHTGNRRKENNEIRSELKECFGFTDEDIASFGKVGSGSWYLGITAFMRSTIVNYYCGLAHNQ